MAKKYIWWVGHKGGSIGSWSSKKEAEKAIKDGIKAGVMNSSFNWKAIRYEAIKCPSCGSLTEKETVESFGVCLSCDHITGDIQRDEVE